MRLHASSRRLGQPRSARRPPAGAPSRRRRGSAGEGTERWRGEGARAAFPDGPLRRRRLASRPGGRQRLKAHIAASPRRQEAFSGPCAHPMSM